MKSLISFSRGSGFESLEDAALAAALCRGSHEALSVIFDRYSGFVFGIARRILGEDAEAEEVVQQVFLEVFKEIRQFDSKKGNLKAWVLRRASYRALDRKRTLQSQGVYRWTGPSVDMAASNGLGKLLGMSAQEIGRLAEQLLATLSPRQEAVVRMRFFRGLSLKEIQTEMKETMPAVRHLLYDALKILRAALLDQGSRAERRARNIGRS